MKKVLKLIGIVFLSFGLVLVLVVCLYEKEPSLIIPVIIFTIPIVLLSLSLRKTQKANDWIKIDTSPEQMKALKKSVTKYQIQDSIRIMNDCMKIMKSTKN